jgi:uncharacterized Zn finger protein
MISFSTQDIIYHCGKESYQKGCSCASSNSFVKTFIQENILFGLYQGTSGMYRVNIVFNNNNGLEYAWCTCPAMSQFDGRCKHIAGLMIFWHKSPDAFRKLEPWQSALQDKSKDDLMQLIVKAAARSIEMSSALHEELFDEPLLDEEELYDPEEW